MEDLALKKSPEFRSLGMASCKLRPGCFTLGDVVRLKFLAKQCPHGMVYRKLWSLPGTAPIRLHCTTPVNGSCMCRKTLDHKIFFPQRPTLQLKMYLQDRLNCHRETPLLLASQTGQLQVVCLLLKAFLGSDKIIQTPTWSLRVTITQNT